MVELEEKVVSAQVEALKGTLESAEKIKILFLVESGSRAWGWESEDSDYDIRGVFVQEDTVFNKKDQISIKVADYDVELWSLQKFLTLFAKSNPTCWEWLSSDIIYSDSTTRRELRDIFQRTASKFTLKKHYVSMAKGNFDKYIDGTEDKVNLKKYVYILRSIGCVEYLQKKMYFPPKNYRQIIEYLPTNVQKFFEKIVKDKRNSEDMTGSRNHAVEKYITSFWDKEFKKDQTYFNLNYLDDIFRRERYGS